MLVVIQTAVGTKPGLIPSSPSFLTSPPSFLTSPTLLPSSDTLPNPMLLPYRAAQNRAEKYLVSNYTCGHLMILWTARTER